MSKRETLKVDVLLDSGAFSAWTRKEEIDIKNYIAFLKEYDDYIWHSVNLDVIPGARDEVRTRAQVEESAKLSYRNQQIMKDAGLRPVPVFHQGEPFTWLERLLKDGETYIGISPFKDIPISIQCQWLDECFTALTNSNGVPFVRIHGFGTTQPELLIRYPFYTVDSTTWSMTPGMGQIIVPSYHKGKFNYLDKKITRYAMSHREMSVAQKRRFNYLPQMQQDIIEKYLQEEVGCSAIQACYSAQLRRKAVLIYYIRLAQQLRGTRFKYKRATLTDQIEVPRTFKPIENMPFWIVFATNFSAGWSLELNEVNARKRLLSYYEVRNRPEVIVTYARDGILNKAFERKMPRPWSSGYEDYRRLKLINKMSKVIDGQKDKEEVT